MNQTVIIGSGIAGITLAEKFKQLQPDAAVAIVTYENFGYYSRPMLSHGFSREGIEQTIVLKPFEALRDNGIAVHNATTVTMIDRTSQTVTFDNGTGATALPYDNLILAPGSEAFVPPPLQAFHGLFYTLNSLADLKLIRGVRQTVLANGRQPRWAIIGGGLIGCEVASDLTKAGDQVTLFHAMDRLMERQLHPEDSQRLLEVLGAAGVKTLLEQAVQGFDKTPAGYTVITQQGASEAFDAIIVACGFKPRTQLAANCGLAVGRGVKADKFLRTADAHIYALGDVAELPDGKVYAFIRPIVAQAQWLAKYLAGQTGDAWEAPKFSPKAKVHGFEPAKPFL